MLEAETCCRIIRSFDGEFDAVGAPKRVEHLRNLRQKALKWQQKKKPLKRQKAASAQSHGVRTDSGPIALQAFWGMHVEAMNFIGMGLAEHAVALDSHRIRCAFDAIAWNNTATKRTGVPCFIGVPGAIKQRC